MAEGKKSKYKGSTGGGDAFYCLGLLGAAVYYVQQANGFGEVLVALLKALVWPAFFVYDVLKYIAA